MSCGCRRLVTHFPPIRPLTTPPPKIGTFQKTAVRSYIKNDNQTFHHSQIANNISNQLAHFWTYI